MIRYRFFSVLALFTLACGSGGPDLLPDEGTTGSHDAGAAACTAPDTGPDVIADASPSSLDGDAGADAHDAAQADVYQGPPPVQAPWSIQDCWFGPPAYLGVPPCPHGAYVECFASEAGGGLGYCDDMTPTCHLMEDGTYHCPAGTRTMNPSCVLQPDSVQAWPSTYTYACAGTARP